MPTAVELPANFRSISELSNAVDSSLNTISTGIQAAQNLGVTNISDSLHSFDAILPPIGSPPQSLHSLTDAGAIASPDHYLNQAQEFVGKDTLKTFSTLAPMNEVLQKLMDPNLEQQKSLRSFSDLLSNFRLGDILPGDANSAKGLGIAHEAKHSPDIGIAHEFKHAREIGIAHEAKHTGDIGIAHEAKHASESKYAPEYKYHAPDFKQALEFKFGDAPLDKQTPNQATEAKIVRFNDPGFTPKISGEQRDIDPGFSPAGIGDANINIDAGFTPPTFPEDSIADKWTPSDPGFIPRLPGDAIGDKDLPSDPGFTPLPNDAQRIFDLQNTLQNIVSLNRGISEF